MEMQDKLRILASELDILQVSGPLEVVGGVSIGHGYDQVEEAQDGRYTVVVCHCTGVSTLTL